MRSRAGRYLLVLLSLSCFAVPCGSWVLSAFDFPVRSLLSDEGWRWLFVHGIRSMVNYWGVLFFLFLTAVGTVEYNGLFSRRQRLSHTGLYASLAVLVLLLAVLFLAATYTQSPLLSLTGNLRHSPFLVGLLPSLCLVVMIASYVYGIFSMHIRGIDGFCDMLAHGFRHHAVWLLNAMFLSFLVECLKYILA